MVYQVYVKTNDAKRITSVNSSGFLSDLTGWTKIDEGGGDKFYLAQSHYFKNPLMDGRGVYRYKLEDGNVIELSKGQMDADYVQPEALPTQEDRIAALEKENKQLKEALDLLLSGVTEEEVTVDG